MNCLECNKKEVKDGSLFCGKECEELHRKKSMYREEYVRTVNFRTFNTNAP